MTTTNTARARPTRAALRGRPIAKSGWTKVAPRIYIAIRSVTFRDIRGRIRTCRVALRIDGRGDGYRVDEKTLAGMPWTAIDGLNSGAPGLRRLRDAKAFAARWLAAANAERTLSPRLDRRPRG